jgi:nucleotide-binding universal stress UspA family protein
VYQHILIASDGSKLADKAVAAGLALAAALKAKATAVTAEEPLETLMMAEASQRLPIAEFERAGAESARRILAEIRKRAQARGIDCATVQVNDFAAPAILATAKAQGCDLIVMSSHGRRGLDRLFLGSQARRVLAHSPVPALICKQ